MTKRGAKPRGKKEQEAVQSMTARYLAAARASDRFRRAVAERECPYDLLGRCGEGVMYVIDVMQSLRKQSLERARLSQLRDIYSEAELATVNSVASIQLIPLWGRALDRVFKSWPRHLFEFGIGTNLIPRIIPQFDPDSPDFWERLCEGLLQNRRQRIDKRLLNKHWEQLLPLVRWFIQRSQHLFNQIESTCAIELAKFDVQEYPLTRLAVLEVQLRRFRVCFLRSAMAAGPYIPRTENPVQADLKQDIGLEMGTLSIEVSGEGTSGNTTHCSFVGSDGQVTEWDLPWQAQTRGSRLDFHENVVFRTWAYGTGMQHHEPETEQSAYWFIDDTSEIDREESRLENADVLCLSFVESCKAVLGRAQKVVRGDLPCWMPGKVRWSYLQDLDDVIHAAKLTRKLQMFEAWPDLTDEQTLSLDMDDDISREMEFEEKIAELGDTEQHIINTLGKKKLTGEEIAIAAQLPYNSNLKTTLAGLRKRNILGNKAPGYFLNPAYYHLLKPAD